LVKGRKSVLAFWILRSPIHEHADAPHALALLRARCERPRGGRATNNGDEFPPPHGAYPKAKDHGRSIAGVGVGQWRASQ
jgi:hypothetical protein